MGEEDAFAEQVEFGAAEHLPFGHFDAVDVAFDSTGAMRQGEAVTDGVVVASEAVGVGVQFGQVAGLDDGDPGVEAPPSPIRNDRSNGQPPILTAKDEAAIRAELRRLWADINYPRMPEKLVAWSNSSPEKWQTTKNQVKALSNKPYIADITGAEVDVKIYGGKERVRKVVPGGGEARLQGAAKFIVALDVIAFGLAVQQYGLKKAISGYIYLMIGDLIYTPLCPPPPGYVGGNCAA